MIGNVYASRAICGVLYVSVFALCAIVDDFRPGFLLAAAFSLLFFLSGAVFFPRRLVAFKVGIPGTGAEVGSDQSILVAGTQIQLQPSPQFAVCTLGLRHGQELIACGILSITTIAVVLSGKASYEQLMHGFALFILEGACMAGGLILLFCQTWLVECRFLRRAHVTLGFPLSVGGGLVRQHLTYQFLVEGQRYGGYTSLGGGPEMLVVFFEPRNPAQNLTQRSLLFHSVQVAFLSSASPAQANVKSPDHS